jgi:serine/threonine protein kinase HipA of HipAB toxin-antitoxin module
MDDNNLTAIIETPVRYDKETAWVRDAQEEFICEVDTKRVGEHIATCINDHKALTAQVAELRSQLQAERRRVARDLELIDNVYDYDTGFETAIKAYIAKLKGESQ